MDILFGSILGFLVGILVSVLAVRWLVHRLIDRIADAIERDRSQESEAKEIKLKIEFDQNTYFMYNVTDGSFVAQGANIAQIRERLRERFPEYNATVVDGDPEAVEKLREELKLNPDENSNSIRHPS